MLSRRELITAGVAGGLHPNLNATAEAAASASRTELQSDREALLQVKGSIDRIQSNLERSLLSNSLSYGFVGKIRASMEQFFRSNAKFPDFMEIGITVFLDLYDWHIKNRQQLTVTRGTDGRYWMQFMFTTMLLRGEVDPTYIGIPYDKA